MTSTAVAIGTGSAAAAITLSASSVQSAASSFNPTSIDNSFPANYTTTALDSTQTAVPTVHRPLGCGGGFQNPPTIHPACAMQAFNASAELLLRCCNGAERILYASNCNIYCDAQNQTLRQLNDCLSRGINGTGSGQLGGAICNRIGTSYSSLLSEETDTSSFGQPTATSTSNVAARPGGALPLGLGSDVKTAGISLAAWGTVALLAMTGFAGLLV